MRERGRVTVLDCVRDTGRERTEGKLKKKKKLKLGESEDQQQGFCLTVSEYFRLSDPSHLTRLVVCAGLQILQRILPSKPAQKTVGHANAISISSQHD